MNSDSKLLRGLLYSVYRSYSRLFLGYPPPRLVLNCLPKSGTHLLRRLLSMAPDFRYSGLHIENRRFLLDLNSAQNPDFLPRFDLPRLERSIDSTRQGQFVTSHLFFDEALQAMFERLDFKMIALLRDPRDLAVSHAKYIARLRRNILHHRYMDELRDDDARLMASIRGLPPRSGQPALLDIGLRLRRFHPWLDRPQTLTCRFEALVGPQGGGSRERQLEAIESILRFIDRPLVPARVSTLAERLWSPSSATFRRGVIGDWRNHFSPAHTEAFKQIAGEALIQLGYEKDMDW